MILTNDVQNREEDRQSIAARMAEYEAKNGPVQTMPIQRGAHKEIPFSITPSNKQGRDQNARVLSDLANKRVTANTVKKRNSAKKIDKLREMAPKGAQIIDMCDATGLTPNVVMRYLREHNIQRGPQIDLEAV